MIPIRTKEPSPKKGQKKEKCIPIMLVQALQQQNAACEKDTAGRPSWESPRGPAGVWSASEGGAFYHLYPPRPPRTPKETWHTHLNCQGEEEGKKMKLKVGGENVRPGVSNIWSVGQTRPVSGVNPARLLVFERSFFFRVYNVFYVVFLREVYEVLFRHF